MDLAEYCQELGDASVEASEWIERNPETVRNEKESLLKELRKARRTFRKCQKAAGRKMCAGVFGPSQAGKSYLISALARGQNNELTAKFGSEEHDFISEINPEGGKESTGLVTRFTLEAPRDLPEGYPVHLRLLSEMDLVKIIANTYYADCEHKEEAKSDIAAALGKLQKKAGAPNGRIDLDDMEELREYLYKDFRSKARVQELERSFWDVAIEIAPRLDLESRVKLYALIWDETEEFTDLLLRLLRALEKLDYSEELYCAMDSLTPREKSVIDVATLNGLGDDSESEELAVCSPGGIKTTLPRPIVTALTAELTIVIKDKPADYFDHTDLLDFPGYRSRFKIDDARRELKKDGMRKELFLRGKVAYLFQRYCAERELNSMLLCIGPGNQEVQDLPGVINDWVCSTHGEKPEDRAGKSTSLLFILTKFDMEFEEKKGAPSVETRWDTRLHASLLDFFGKQHDWPTQWTPDRGFDNLYLLRNPNFKFKSVLTYQGDREIGVQEDSKKLVEDLRSSFMNSEEALKHFKDPATAWEEAMRLNDGGISYIRESLSPLCDPNIKRQQLLQTIETNRSALERRLKAFYQSDDREELRKQKIQLVATLFLRLKALDKTTHRLSHLVKALGAPDGFVNDLHEEAMRKYRELREAEANMEKLDEKSNLEAIDADTVNLASLLGDDEDETVEAAQTESASTDDEAGFFANYIESRWVKNLHDMADDPAMQKYFGLGAQEFSALVSELATGAARMGHRASMSEAFRKAAGFSDSRKASVLYKQAAIASRIINNYVDWLGFNPHTRSEKERTVTLPNSKPQTVFSPPPEINGLPTIEPRGKKGEIAYVNRWANNWLSSLGALILDNVDFDGKQTINAEENRLLSLILKRFNAQKIEERQN